MQQLHGRWFYIESVELESRLFGAEIGWVVRGSDGFFFAREKRKIVVLPEDGHDVVAAFTSGQTGMNHKGDTRTGILHAEADDRLFRFPMKFCSGFEFHLRQRIQAGEVGEIFLRSVNRVGTASPIHGVKFGGEPVEIVVNEFTRSIVQLEFQKISGGELRGPGQIEGPGNAVGGDVDRSILRGSLSAVDLVELRGNLQRFQRLVETVDDGDGIIVVTVLDMDNFHGLFGAEITASRDEIVVVEVPDEGRPGIVEHPLNQTGGGVLVSAVRLEHRALIVVGHGLGLALIVVEGRCRTIAPGQGFGEDVDGGEAFSARVEIPVLVDGPEVLFRNELGEAFFGRNGRPGLVSVL